MATGVSVKNFTRFSAEMPRASFAAVAARVLPRWDISLAFVGPSRARALNRKLRKKEYVPNVLSYIVGEKSAEVIICPAIAARQASSYQLTTTDYTLLLFIHGLLHIKGWVHSGTMEQCEQKLLTRYGTAHSHRHRHRHVPGKGGGGRRVLR